MKSAVLYVKLVLIVNIMNMIMFSIYMVCEYNFFNVKHAAFHNLYYTVQSYFNIYYVHVRNFGRIVNIVLCK